eukprot:1158939-Pelagomonas_calceolata.AAC.5
MGAASKQGLFESLMLLQTACAEHKLPLHPCCRSKAAAKAAAAKQDLFKSLMRARLPPVNFYVEQAPNRLLKMGDALQLTPRPSWKPNLQMCHRKGQLHVFWGRLGAVQIEQSAPKKWHYLSMWFNSMHQQMACLECEGVMKPDTWGSVEDPFDAETDDEEAEEFNHMCVPGA